MSRVFIYLFFWAIPQDANETFEFESVVYTASELRCLPGATPVVITMTTEGEIDGSSASTTSRSTSASAYHERTTMLPGV